MIFFHIILHPAVLIYDFIYIHNFIIILSRVYNEPIQRPARSWLVSSILVECGTAIAEGQGFESRTSLNFFRLSFHNCKSYIAIFFLIIHIKLHVHVSWWGKPYPKGVLSFIQGCCAPRFNYPLTFYIIIFHSKGTPFIYLM